MDGAMHIKRERFVCVLYGKKPKRANTTTWSKLPLMRPCKLSSPRLTTVVHPGNIWNRTLPARIASTHSCITRIGRQGWGRCSVTEMTGMKRPVVIILSLRRLALVQIAEYTVEKRGSPSNCIHLCWWMWIRSDYWPTKQEDCEHCNEFVWRCPMTAYQLAKCLVYAC